MLLDVNPNSFHFSGRWAWSELFEHLENRKSTHLPTHSTYSMFYKVMQSYFMGLFLSYRETPIHPILLMWPRGVVECWLWNSCLHGIVFYTLQDKCLPFLVVTLWWVSYVLGLGVRIGDGWLSFRAALWWELFKGRGAPGSHNIELLGDGVAGLVPGRRHSDRLITLISCLPVIFVCFLISYEIVPIPTCMQLCSIRLSYFTERPIDWSTIEEKWDVLCGQ
jgi:hypothetical protein